MSKFNNVDGHGQINILCANEWQDIKLIDTSREKRILGCTLNSLLLGIFRLFGTGGKMHKFRAPGGFQAWEILIESVFVTIFSFATVEEIMVRINEVFVVVYNSHPTGEEEALGSLSFLFFWLLCFRDFISDLNLYRILDSVERLKPILPMSSAHSTQSSIMVECCGRYGEVRNLIHHVISERSGLMNCLDRNDPNISLSRGYWTGRETQLKREQLKESLAKAPKLKLEIFGGDMLMDQFDDSDSEGDRESGAEQAAQTRVQIEAPISRIQDGFNLLQDPKMLMVDLLHLDALELARQWTLIDHCLFCAIPLHSLLSIAAATFSQPRHKQIRAGSGLCGNAGAARRFIDHFNATSGWVTHTVLSRGSPEDRAASISQFIKLAGHLADMGNFNGMFAILSAMAQGCVSRLEVTWDCVAKDERNSLLKLQKLMAQNKNYQRYRDEVSRLCQVMATREGADCEAFESSIEWRKFVYERHFDSKLQSSNLLRATGRSEKTGSVADSSGLGTEDRTLSDKIHALVPHVGAHLSELTQITDGNSDFLSDCPHLFNLDKAHLLASTATLLQKLQRMRYPFTPLRSVAAAINTVVKQHLRLQTLAGEEHRNRLHALSHSQEPDHVVKEHRDRKKLAAGDSSSSQATRTAATSDSNTARSDVRSVGSTQSGSSSKFRKSGAYEAILSGTTAHRSDSPPQQDAKGRKPVPGSPVKTRSVTFTGQSYGDEEQKPKSVFRKASALMRTMSFRS